MACNIITAMMDDNKFKNDLFNTLIAKCNNTDRHLLNILLQRYDRLSLFENPIWNKRKSDPNQIFVYVYIDFNFASISSIMWRECPSMWVGNRQLQSAKKEGGKMRTSAVRWYLGCIRRQIQEYDDASRNLRSDCLTGDQWTDCPFGNCVGRT